MKWEQHSKVRIPLNTEAEKTNTLIKVSSYCRDLIELLGSSSRSLRRMQDSGPRLLNCRLRTTETGRQNNDNTQHSHARHAWESSKSIKMHFEAAINMALFNTVKYPRK